MQNVVWIDFIVRCVSLYVYSYVRRRCHLESQGEVIKYWAWNNKDVIVMHFYIYKLNIHIKPLASETSEFYLCFVLCCLCNTQACRTSPNKSNQSNNLNSLSYFLLLGMLPEGQVIHTHTQKEAHTVTQPFSPISRRQSWTPCRLQGACWSMEVKPRVQI